LASTRPSSAFVQCFFLDSANLLFGLEPVIEFGARLIAAQHIKLVGSKQDTILDWKLLP
jgi:hypothetical protein